MRKRYSSNRLTRPLKLKGDWPIYGNEFIDGEALWELFCAAADGHMPTIKALVAEDPRLVNGQYWYSIPLRFAVLGGHIEAVRFLLDAGSKPGLLEANLYIWEDHLEAADMRGFNDLHRFLLDEMKKRFRFDPENEEFAVLKEVISDGQISDAKRMLLTRPELNTISDVRGNSALHMASEAGSKELVELCLDGGADIEALNIAAESPFDVATDEVRHLLIDRGATYDFFAACCLGDAKRVEDFLTQDPGMAKRLGRSFDSPLMRAAASGHLRVVEMLLDHGADPNLKELKFDRGGALFMAGGRGHYDVAKLLLERGADANGPCESSGTCADHAANEEILALLISHGSQGKWDEMDHSLPDLRKSIRDKRHDLDGDHRFSLLGQVIREKDPELLAFYIENMGTEMIKRAHPGLGRSGWLVPSGASEEFLEQLIAAGLEVDRPDWLGRMHLHFLANRNDLTGAKFFLDHGADINAVCLAERWTPLGYAARGNRPEMIEYLISRGADVSLPHNSPGTQPLAVAKSRNNSEALAALQRAS